MATPKKANPQKGGRPSAYKPEYAAQAMYLCPDGATDEVLANAFSVTVATINRWKLAHPEFCEALKAGKREADTTIATSLFMRAKGFEYKEAVPIKLKTVIYENGKRVREDERIETVMVTRVVPPDTTACIFWLKNRQTASWRDIKAVEVSGPNGTPVQVQEWKFGDKAVSF